MGRRNRNERERVENVKVKANLLLPWCLKTPTMHTYITFNIASLSCWHTTKNIKTYIQAIIIAMPRVIWDAWKRKSFDNREDDADRCGRGIQMYMQFPFFFRSVRRGVIFKNYPKMGFWVHSSSFDHVNSIERDGGLYCVWTGQALLSI